MSERTLIFAGEDEKSAVNLLNTLRARDIGGALRSAFFFEGAEPAARVIIMEDVPDFVAAPIKAAFPGIVHHREFAPAQTGDEKFGSGIGTREVDPFAPLMAAYGESLEARRSKEIPYEGKLSELLPGRPKRRGRPPGSKNKNTTI